MPDPDGPLSGRVALVTGVSRPAGIGLAVARCPSPPRPRATVFATGCPPHDAEMPWGEASAEAPFPIGLHDLADPLAPGLLVDEVVAARGRIDIVVSVHARSSGQDLGGVTAAELDRVWATNVRSVVLLAQAFADRHAPAPSGEPPLGRMIWFTSGQHLGPMDHEIAYAVSKGALHQMTASIDHALAVSRIVANCINPGPVDTGWADAATREAERERFPDRRWGTPTDVANLVEFLVGNEGAWIRGQVLNSEGGFDRFA